MSRMKSNCARHGFTLVELVVVILVIGIIAAIAAPRMFDAANDARTNATRSSLVVVRDAIELHRAQNGVYPGDAGTEADFKDDLKPFLKGAFPRVEVGSNTGDIVRVETAGTPLTVIGTESWAYDNATGEFVVNDATYVTW